MVSEKIVIRTEKGLHLRPAGKICDLALSFKSHSRMKIGDSVYNLKSMLSVLSAQVTSGVEIEITCEGADEKEALKALCDLMTGDLDAS